MKRTSGLGAFVVGMCLLAGVTSALPLPERFRPAFVAHLEGAAEVPPSAAERAAELDYVFVNGFVGEILRPLGGGFRDVRRELTRLGVPRDQLHVLYPSSAVAVEVNASGFLAERLRAIARNTPRKLVLVAHSKGAAELLMFAAHDPDFIERHVDSIFFLQGAFGGSPIADYVVGDPLPEYESNGSLRTGMAVMGWLTRVLSSWLGGVESLTTARSRQRIETLLTERREAIARLASRMVFVRTWEDACRTCVKMRLGARFLDAIGVGPTDGTVPFESQYVPGIGTEITLEHIDHSLPCSRLVTQRGPERSAAFARALACSVGN